jgi:DNA-binding PadR family transcriptional regulator
MTTHTSTLIKGEYVTVKKEFIKNKPLTTYHLTKKGRKEFNEYVEILNVLKKGK